MDRPMPDRYTDQEIVELYRRGRRDPQILHKLCELTLLPEDKLLPILHLAGEALDIEQRPRKKRGTARKFSDQLWREIIAMRLQGVSYEAIIRRTGINSGSLRGWRKQAQRLGVPLPDDKIIFGIQSVPESNRKEDQPMDKNIKPEPEERDPLFNRMYDAIRLFKSSGYKGSFKLEYSEGVLSVLMAIESKGESE